jgi:hypothetical protein
VALIPLQLRSAGPCVSVIQPTLTGDKAEDVYKLTYVRDPSGIIVMLADELKKS